MNDQYAVASSSVPSSVPQFPEAASAATASPSVTSASAPPPPRRRVVTTRLVGPHTVDKDSPELVWQAGAHWLKLRFSHGGRRLVSRVCLQTNRKPEAVRRAREVIAYYARPNAPRCEFVWFPQTPVQSDKAPRLREYGPRRRHLTGALGLQGWDALEPVLLAALAAEEPLLLVGTHGTAKSLLVERLAALLGLESRTYNASVLHFDDLVGVPLPEPGGARLRYVGTASAVWDAQFVFFDELSRTRPELQNKVFPIVHERRVHGEALAKLRYCWAAMNPPGTGAESADYAGAEPLDQALADRFAFLVRAPGWRDLTETQQRRVLLGSEVEPAHCDVPGLIAEARRLYTELSTAPLPRLAQYFVEFDMQRKRVRLPDLSTRRLRTLLRSTLAVQAARVALAALDGLPSRSVEWEDSIWLAVAHGMPELAERGELDLDALREVHRRAWQLSGNDRQDPWTTILQLDDPIERFVTACAFGPALDDHALTQVVLQGLSSLKQEHERAVYSVVAFLALQRTSGLPAVAFEALAQRARPILQPGNGPSLPADAVAKGWGRVEAMLEKRAAPAWRPFAARILAADRHLWGFCYDGTPDGTASGIVVCSLFEKLWSRLGLARLATQGGAA